MIIFLGLFIALFGSMIFANAAFSDRAQAGVIVFLGGAILIIGGVIELLIGWLL